MGEVKFLPYDSPADFCGVKEVNLGSLMLLCQFPHTSIPPHHGIRKMDVTHTSQVLGKAEIRTWEMFKVMTVL